jgi:adenosine deaminase
LPAGSVVAFVSRCAPPGLAYWRCGADLAARRANRVTHRARVTAPEGDELKAIGDFIAGMPKCELHLHIEGTLEPELKFALAARNAIALPYASPAEMRAAYTFNDLASFLKIYYEGMAVLIKEQDFYDLAYAYLTKARAQNVLYVEMFFDPQAHTGRGVPFGTVVSGLRRAQLDAEKRLGIRSSLIMCFLRDWSAEFAMATLLESLPYKAWIIGVGLDSDERGNPPIKFRAVFARAREEGYLLTMHCDVNQADSVAHIWQCLDVIGVARIDHGVNALEDPALCAALKERALALTVCPISNSFVTADPQAASVRAMLDGGLRVTINSDDPAYFGGYITENFALVQREAGLSIAELRRLSANAFEAAWLPSTARETYLALLASYAPER